MRRVRAGRPGNLPCPRRCCAVQRNVQGRCKRGAGTCVARDSGALTIRSTGCSSAERIASVCAAHCCRTCSRNCASSAAVNRRPATASSRRTSSRCDARCVSTAPRRSLRRGTLTGISPSGAAIAERHNRAASKGSVRRGIFMRRSGKVKSLCHRYATHKRLDGVRSQVL